ncbi:hypothetical protein [Cellulosimicrobium sp. CUA-896]|uniref:hypothetical protein n=1 Tax=Cellulosimicrobium sp. CUA-896 TaxID=1517881 RepID=UPI000962B7CC|nr:hypothetical protein [Cellulosimicrobium sp. CUA-896]OLT49427.1 hypothetical protein BJF88_02980 [Cellulosimicrobium sp. CUA-896]
MSPPPPVLRVLLGFGLLGAGIVNLGLVRGTFPAPAGLLALALGLVEVPAALATIAGTAPRTPRPAVLGRAAVGALVVGSVAQAALAVAPGTTLGPTVTAATALQLAGAGTIGVLTRSSAPGPAADAPPPSASSPSPAGAPHGGAGRPRPALGSAASLGVLFVGAVAVATVTTFGLSGTEAAEHAVPHSEHHLPDLPGLHHHP